MRRSEEEGWMLIRTAKWELARRWGGWGVTRRLEGGERPAASGEGKRDMCVSITWNYQQCIPIIGHANDKGSHEDRIDLHLQYCVPARKPREFGHSQHLFDFVSKCNPRRTRLHSHL
jgi:hypothetical protein